MQTKRTLLKLCSQYLLIICLLILWLIRPRIFSPGEIANRLRNSMMSIATTESFSWVLELVGLGSISQQLTLASYMTVIGYHLVFVAQSLIVACISVLTGFLNNSPEEWFDFKSHCRIHRWIYRRWTGVTELVKWSLFMFTGSLLLNLLRCFNYETLFISHPSKGICPLPPLPTKEK